MTEGKVIDEMEGLDGLSGVEHPREFYEAQEREAKAADGIVPGLLGQLNKAHDLAARLFNICGVMAAARKQMD